jgi:DNA (cytosine-5)-methyltransferase 1
MSAAVATAITAVDSFAGPGGWDVAAAALGIDTTGIEWDQSACDTRKAAGHATVQADVSLLNPLHYAARLQIGSPPCQGFSLAGNGKGRNDSVALLSRLETVHSLTDLLHAIDDLRPLMTDEKTLLALEPLRWALTTKPDFISWEQVIAVLPIWEAAARILRLHGYSVSTGVLTAEMFGVPQTRKRAILVARSAEMSFRMGPVALPVPTHSKYHSRTPWKLDPGMPKWVSMAEALGWSDRDLVGFPRKADRGEVVTIDGVDYRARDLRAAESPSFVVTEKARSWSRYPEHADGPVDVVAMGDVRNSHGCIRPIDAPAPTLTASMDNGNYQFVPADYVYRSSNQAHAARRPLDAPAPTVVMGARANKVEWMPPELAADPKASGIRVSLAEAACLQSFPDQYPWQGTRSQQFQQVGNAIPCLLAWHVLKATTGIDA